MNSKNLATKRSLIVLFLLLLMPLQAAAALHLEFGIEPNYSLAFANPAKDYFKDLNEDFRTGIYTWKIPMPDWKDIKTPSFNEFGGEGSCLVKLKSGKIKKPRVGVVLGYRISSPKSNYNESYKDVYCPFTKSYGDMKFNRQESIRTSTFTLGARGKANLIDKLDVSTTLGVNFYNVKGDVDYTRKTMYPWYTKECVNLHKADYKGNGTGFMIEAGADYKVVKSVLVGVAFGYRTGKAQAKGNEVRTQSTWPKGYSQSKEYSPKFNFNSTYGKFYIGMSF